METKYPMRIATPKNTDEETENKQLQGIIANIQETTHNIQKMASQLNEETSKEKYIPPIIKTPINKEKGKGITKTLIKSKKEIEEQAKEQTTVVR